MNKIIENENKVTLTGVLIRDGIVKTTRNGDKVVLLNLATKKKFQNKKTGKIQEKIDYHNLITYGNYAIELAKDIDRLKKGIFVSIQGEIDNFSYELDGIKRYGSRIVVKNLEIVN